MLTPALQGPDERGKRWLQAKVQEILAAGAVALAPPSLQDTPACYWGTGAATDTTLYVWLAGAPAPTALAFSRPMIAQCGSGLYAAQHNAILLIRRTLKKMGILSA